MGEHFLVPCPRENEAGDMCDRAMRLAAHPASNKGQSCERHFPARGSQGKVVSSCQSSCQNFTLPELLEARVYQHLRIRKQRNSIASARPGTLG